MGNRLARMVFKQLRRVSGQSSIAPRGVSDQSCERTSSAISPSPLILPCECGEAASLPNRAAEDWPLAIACTLICSSAQRLDHSTGGKSYNSRPATEETRLGPFLLPCACSSLKSDFM